MKMIMIEESKLNQALSDKENIELRLSQSRVSDFDRNGPQTLIKPSNPDGNGIKHGSIVDILLVDTLTGCNEIDKLYAIIDEQKPTAMLGTLCDIILNNYNEIPLKNDIIDIVKLNNLWKNLKEETISTKFDLPEFWNYLKHKFETKDKTVISTDDFSKAKSAVDILINHKFTHSLFSNQKDIEHLYQISFEIEYNRFKFRGILDKITINHNDKTVYFEDIKTGEGKHFKFMESFLKYRYYFQGYLYQQAYDYLSKKYNFEGYELKPFKFIYISRSENFPIIFEMTDKWYNSAKYGFITKNGYKCRGFDECLDDIYYHWKTQNYEYTREIIENKGILKLNDNFITTND